MSLDLKDQLQSTIGDRYRVDAELGGGGMARVFAATDLTTGERVAVKVLSPDLAAGVDRERFRREIQWR
jgi:serine/threonine-protein kinase